MATITKRGDTFRIKVSLGYDTEHKQIVKSTTFKPPQGVTPKKAEKLAQQFAYDFENKCKDYTELNENMRFSELADWYFENYAPIELKPSGSPVRDSQRHRSANDRGRWCNQWRR